ncbi:MAG TPA: hypothetical protein VGY75_09545 [Candidatus Udaeobacter sp.]|jgi:hypothetical protein|nr:hypothetical protein [Candidatus Udaeobacter sp.]
MNCEGCPERELTGLGKWLLGFYLGSGAAGSVYGTANSLITLLLWVIIHRKSYSSALNSRKSMRVARAAV